MGRRYECGLLWHDDSPLKENRMVAIGQLTHLERWFASNPNFAEVYKREMDKYVNLKYLHKLTRRKEPSNTRTN